MGRQSQSTSCPIPIYRRWRRRVETLGPIRDLALPRFDRPSFAITVAELPDTARTTRSARILQITMPAVRTAPPMILGKNRISVQISQNVINHRADTGRSKGGVLSFEPPPAPIVCRSREAVVRT